MLQFRLILDTHYIHTMRKLHLFVFAITLLLSVPLKSQTPWTRLSGDPQENTLNHVSRIPGTEAVISVGDGATVLMSPNRGVDWQLMLNPAGTDNHFICQSACFTNGFEGFIAGSKETILKSVDGGLTWQTAFTGNPSNPEFLLHDIVFNTASHGLAVGNNGKLVVTTDGGNTWTGVQSAAPFDLRHVAFADSLTGFITGSSSLELLKTINGGESWQLEPLDPAIEGQYITDIAFINHSVGFLACTASEYTSIFKTTDGGVSWEQVFKDWPSHNHGQFLVDDSEKGYFVMSTLQYVTRTLVTTDGGESWNSFIPTNLTDRAFNACCLTGADSLLVVGQSGTICHSVDGGVSYSHQEQNFFKGLIQEIQFTDPLTGFLMHEVAEGGVASSALMKTTDGGNTWSRIDDFYFYRGSFCFLSNDTGFVVTDSPELTLHTTHDGGINWESRPIPFELNPLVIKFADNLHGMIGSHAKAIITHDGGLNWTEVVPALFGNYDILDIEYRHEQEIWATGHCYGNHAILKTTDGGTTWEEIPISDFEGAADLFFHTDSIAFLASYNKILRSDDGGTTWYQALCTNEHPISLRKVFFPSAATGYAIGEGEFENMLKSVDGGITWKPLVTNQTTPLTGVYFSDADNGLVVGDKGLLMKTATGGVASCDQPVGGNALEIFTIQTNPVTDRLIVRFRQKDGSPDGNIAIFDAAGRFILSERVQTGVPHHQLSVKELLPGIYFVVFSDQHGGRWGKKALIL